MSVDVIAHSLTRELVDQLVEARFGDVISGLKADLVETQNELEAVCVKLETAVEHRDRLRQVLLSLNDGALVADAEVIALSQQKLDGLRGQRGTGLYVVPTAGGDAA